MKKRVFLFSVVIVIFSFGATAEIYKSVDANGVATYSDQPSTTSTNVILERENVSIKPAAPSNATDATASDKKVEYTAFTISSPKDQDTFPNATEVPISVNVEPALQKGDNIQFYWDGAPFGTASTSTSISIPKVSGSQELLARGSHTIYAAILSTTGDSLKTTPTITVFVHQTSVLQPNYPKPKP